MNGLEEAWKRCCSRLRAELGEDIFTSWFGRLELETAVDGRACFTVPTRFLKSWIESHYLDRILAALNSEIGGIADLDDRRALLDARAGLRRRPGAGA